MGFFNWIKATFLKATFLPRFNLRSLQTCLLVCALIYVSRKRLTRQRDDEDELPGPTSPGQQYPNQTRPTEPKSSPTRPTDTHAISSYQKDAKFHERIAGYEPEYDLERQTKSSDSRIVAEAGPGRLNRTERLFLDRINACDEEELIAACHRMNSEITTCTQAIAEDWAQARSEDPEQANVSSVPPMISGPVGDAIGNEVLRRIQVSKSPRSDLDLESTLEFALRAWTIDCVRTYISSFLLTASKSDLEHIYNELAASG